MFFPLRVDTESERWPVVTYALIALNFLIFGGGQFMPNDDLVLFLHFFGYSPEEGRILTMFTYMFLHGNWMHIIGNMYYLWIFGRALEQVIGSVKFLLFYIAAGVIAVITHHGFVTEVAADVPCIGASGAISGILGAFAVMCPGIPVQCILFLLGMRPTAVLKVPAAFVLGLWFIMQLVMQWALADPSSGSGVAYGAHIGGFLFGLILLGIIRTIQLAIQDWADLKQNAGIQHAAALLNAGQPLTDAHSTDADVQAMAFLKNGVAPGNTGLLAAWFSTLRPQDDDATAASILLRAHLSGVVNSLGTPTIARACRALAAVDQPKFALAALLDALNTENASAEQDLLCTLGGVLWNGFHDRERALACLQWAAALGDSTDAGGRARRLLQLINEQPAVGTG
ncbi:rhomboid family intramembrane serine protease [Verrucomicrobiota bacterium]